MEDTLKLYACSYKEVFTILSLLSDEEWNKIPNDKKEFYYKSMDKEYDFDYDYDKNISEQTLLWPTKAILACIFRDYLANEEEKIEILNREQQENEQIEESKRNKYNPENIFKDRVKEITATENTQMIEYKKTNFMQKIIKKLINLFKS